MDSGLGSDEEQRRSRTKEQKQRHNEQLLNGAHCFIDAASLQDDDVQSSTTLDDLEQRRTEERRQGALLFQSSIPQYSTMLQLAAGGSSGTPPETPFNSMVQIEQNSYSEDSDPVVSKPSLGFYVDLNEVEVETSNADTSASSTTTKNIFSMVIDFEAPKKDMPSRLLRNHCRKRQSGNGKKPASKDTSLQPDSVSSTVDCVCVDSDADTPPPVQLDDSPDSNSHDHVTTTAEETKSDSPKFVKLSDLMHQNAREEPTAEFVGPRMSKSIPESSWVESPLLMSRSAGYRVAPKPMEPDAASLSESTGSQTGPSQRRLGTDLLRMFLEELDTDTVLHVGSPPRIIKAHRCILISRCQYFAGTLRGHSLALDGFSYESVHFALCHIYSGAAHVPDSIGLVELASLADMLSLEGLKEVVAHSLKSRHCHNFHSPCAGCLTGVLEVLPLSAAYGLDELYQRCLKWITANYLRVWPSRAFASLPKELRDKCYQQHVVHMTAATVLETNLSCDRLLVSLPALKWAEPVVQLGIQLAHQCRTFVGQHYAAVLPHLVGLEPWNFPRIEEILLNAAESLSLDQECHVYVRCCSLLDKHKNDINHTLIELLNKLQSHFEKRLLSRGHKLTRSPAWNKMDLNIRAHLKSLGKMEDSTKSSSREIPSRLPRMVSNKTATSSSESSRNSSPATSQAHASPSLRRSLLLAARAPQVPPSPSTARRISTLTMPTQSSAAKSTPLKHPKQTAMTSSMTNKIRPNTAPPAKKPVKYTAPKVPKKESPIVSKPAKPERRPESAVRKQESAVRKMPAPKKNAKAPEKGKKPKQVEIEKPPKSPGMQRSSTFLKEEPTVLTHPSQAQL